MSDVKPELRVVKPSDAGLATLELISQARQSLAEAWTLPDIRRVMEAASVAADAAERAAKLFNAERRAAEVVEAATAAANDAAAVRIEAQAKAGELLAQMAASGERHGQRGDHVSESHAATRSLHDLGVSRSESSRWQQVAAIPQEERQQYIEETKAAKGEVSTAGLLRRGRGGPARVVGGPEKTSQAATFSDGRQRLAQELRRALEALPTYPPALAAELVGDDRKALRRTALRVTQWLGYLMAELRPAAGHHAVTDFERVEAVYTLIHELGAFCDEASGVRLEALREAVEAADRPNLLNAVRNAGSFLADLESELVRQGAGAPADDAEAGAE